MATAVRRRPGPVLDGGSGLSTVICAVIAAPHRLGRWTGRGPSTFPPNIYSAWRVGVVPVLEELGISFDEILLDEVEDPRSPALAERWRREGVPTTEVATPTGTLLRGYGRAG